MTQPLRTPMLRLPSSHGNGSPLGASFFVVACEGMLEGFSRGFSDLRAARARAAALAMLSYFRALMQPRLVSWGARRSACACARP